MANDVLVARRAPHDDHIWIAFRHEVRMAKKTTEAAAERFESSIVELLCTKENHAVLEQQLANRIGAALAGQLSDVDAVNLGADARSSNGS